MAFRLSNWGGFNLMFCHLSFPGGFKLETLQL
jgi:hypothetical protein